MSGTTGDRGQTLDSDYDSFGEALATLQMHNRIEAGLSVPAETPSPEEARNRIAKGIAILGLEDWCPSWNEVRPVFHSWAQWVTGEGDHGGSVAHTIEQIDGTHFGQVARSWYTGELPPDDASVLLISLVGACLKPFLHAHAKRLAPLVTQEQWRRNSCPVCGGVSDFAFLAKKDGARWLLCSRCDATWLFQRLECPHCGNQEQSSLYYRTDETQRYRLYLCDACHGYIKAIDMRNAPEDTDLAMERISTLDLDKQARDLGYPVGGTTLT